MQNRTQIGMLNTGATEDSVGKISEPQELHAANALIELAYGRLPSPNNELPLFPALDANRQNTRSESSHLPLLETAKRAKIDKGKRKVKDIFPLSGAKKNKEETDISSSQACSLSISLASNGQQQVEAFPSIGNHRFSIGPFPSQNPMGDMTVVSRLDQFDPLKLKLGSQNDKTNERDLPKKGKKSSSKKLEAGFIPATHHTGISFPIVHLLSSVRAALIFPHTENYAIWYNSLSQNQGIHNKKPVGTNEFDPDQERNFSLGIHQIVTLVRLRPGDCSILEIEEPLQDLVKGVLKMFSSKTGPIGASEWNPLTVYEKTNKTWSWVGPIPTNNPYNDCVKEGIFSQAWGIPRRNILKLVSCFAKWMKENEEALQKISSLPPPPLTLMYPLTLEERFKDAKALKNLSSIRPSSDEIRDYFRMEENLRYQMPERAFRYTAIDGKQNAVAPLKRGSGKPTVKGREHFLLKKYRPPKFTLLCLVRDAAARLPFSMGTRADVCTLARDSQFVNEEVSESRFNEAVGGGLDRLSFEDDPCVHFDWAKQVWVYLHGDNEDEDFNYVGSTSSKKRRKRQDGSRGEN